VDLIEVAYRAEIIAFILWSLTTGVADAVSVACVSWENRLGDRAVLNVAVEELKTLICDEKGLVCEGHAAVWYDKVQVYSSLSPAFSSPQVQAKMHSCNLL